MGRNAVYKKLGAALIRTRDLLWTVRARLWIFLNPDIRYGSHCRFGQGVKLRATDGGSISLGSGVSIGDFVHLVAARGHIRIDDDVFIGHGTVIVACDSIEIGEATLIAEYVVLRDQDHATQTRPLSKSGLRIAPIKVGRDCWIGCKATVLRGASIADRCVVGAHALVRDSFPRDSFIVGLPARLVKSAGHRGSID